MRVCIRCSASLEGWTCSACGYAPDTAAGYPSFARGEALTTDVSPDDNFEALAQLEDRSFWFRSRNQLVIWALQTYCAGAGSLLEVGCGSGYVLRGVAAAVPRLSLSAVEMFDVAIGIARERVPGATFLQADAANLPFRDEFDAVACLDVLEHIQDDEAVMAEIGRVLRPGGVLVATVPQHRWLWSGVDEYAHHKRRYRRGELESKLRALGFDILFSSSFVSILLPAMLISRLRQRRLAAVDPLAEFRLAPALDRALEGFLGGERWLLRRGLRLPVGASRLVIARRS